MVIVIMTCGNLKRYEFTLMCFVLAGHFIISQGAPSLESNKTEEMSMGASRERPSSPDIRRIGDKESLTQLIDVVFLIVAAILQAKVNILWAASRMLRKLKNPVRKRIGRSLTENEGKERFAELVLLLCKGRNHRYNRMCHRIYELFLISSSMWAFHIGELLFMDSFVALALLLKTGSLAVIGAGVLKWFEVGCIFVVSFVYGGLVFLSSTGVFPVSDVGRRVSLWVDVSITAVTLVDLFIDMCAEYCGSPSDLFSSTQAIIHGNFNKAQKARFEQMEKLARDKNSEKGLDKLDRIWNIRGRRVLIDIVLYLAQCASTIVLIHDEGQFFNMARVAGMEMLEMMAIFLTFVEESSVEPTLYVALMGCAHDMELEP